MGRARSRSRSCRAIRSPRWHARRSGSARGPTCHDTTIVTWQRQSGSVSHCGEPRLWQYRSAIFTHTAEQAEAAAASVAAQREAVLGCLTYAEPVGTFYPAEDYHQK